jgi:hypothetical protein
MSTIVRKIAKKSTFQLKILGLYAQFVRLARERPGLLDKVREEFRAGAKLSPKEDSLLIDYKLRRARNQLDMLKVKNVQKVKIFSLDNKKQQF